MTDAAKHLNASNIVVPATVAEALIETGFDVDVAKTEKTPQHAVEQVQKSQEQDVEEQGQKSQKQELVALDLDSQA